MSERKIDVFFYGLFMEREALIDQGLHPTAARIATVADYELRIGARATLVPAPGKSAWGVVMALPSDEIDRLYSGPTVRTYRPEALIAKLSNGEDVPALCFNLMNPETAACNTEYASRLSDLVARLGCPPEYAAQIDRMKEAGAHKP
jgi:hypothetical protein